MMEISFELFNKVIAENEVGNELGAELVGVEDCLDAEGAVYLDFQTQDNMVSSDDIDQLKKELDGVFEEQGFVPDSHIVTHLEQGQKVIVRMASVKPEEYDFSEVEEYLNSKLGGPDALSSHCQDALARLWEIHRNTSDFFDDKERMFDNIAATLSMCKKVFDKITIKGKEYGTV